jgi:4-amino-4-deoxy-L-arabinose transferase-like glycosyltransferase
MADSTSCPARPNQPPLVERGLRIAAFGLIALALWLQARGSSALVTASLWGAVLVVFASSFGLRWWHAQVVEESEGAPTERAASALLRRGNPLRWVRGGVTALLGALFAFLLMAHDGQLRVGVPLGALLCVVASWGLMDLVGSFDDDGHVAACTEFRSLVGPLLRMAAALVLFGTALSLAHRSALLPQLVWGLVVTASFVAVVIAIFELGVALGPFKEDETGASRPLLERHGFWLIVAAACLYFPTLGSFSLWDPWETHYGEVAREILARDDWISLWWAQDGWFWSKPILDFWIQALAMATVGVHTQPDAFLVGHGTLPVLHPEWVVRTPVVLLTIFAMYVLYKGVAKAFGRRAGLLGGLVLATMPDWFFLARQTMTDMPFVASMTAAMGLLLLGLRTDVAHEARLYEVKVGRLVLRLSGWHLVFGAILVCVVPQILYLASRNLELVLHGAGPYGLRRHWDEFKSGSAGNCGLPGNEACTASAPAGLPRAGVGGKAAELFIRTFGAFEPAVQGLVWCVALGGLLYLNWGERRVRRLYYLGAWLLAALATMGKGPAGFAIPMICVFAYVCTKKRWEELTRLEVVSGLLIILCVALPWYVAMYVRHGSPFTDRLIFHDMFNRAFKHVHDTNEGDDTSFRYYVWQLGYAMYPWTGLVPAGLMYWLRRGDSADHEKGDTSVMLAMWFLFAFGLFSFMGTKFHHYIFPAVPPAAMLVGVVLDDLLGERFALRKLALVETLAVIAVSVTLVVTGAAWFWPGSVFGARDPVGPQSPPSWAFGGLLVGIGLGLAVAWGIWRHKAGETKELSDPRGEHESRMLAASAVGGALVLVLVGRDLVLRGEGDQPGAMRLLQLFTYNYRRPWPDSLDFTAALNGFAWVAVACSLLLAVRALRAHATVAFVALAMVWGLWGTNVYMTKTAPHWGQREVIAAYYQNRKGPEEQLVAYQMNWKGENLYTGNRIPAFVSSGAGFTSWMKKQRDGGAKVMFFVTEHSRVGGLKSEVSGRSYQELTDRSVCNKFVMVRAEL